MPQLKAELAQLVAIPSISVIDYPEETRPEILRAHDAVAALLPRGRRRGVGARAARTRLRSSSARSRRRRALPRCCSTRTTTSSRSGTRRKWESPPFEASERDGAIYGRGAADTKSNILMHIGALRAWGGKPPVGIKIVIEGQEEVGSALTTFPPTRPELFASDAMVIGDMGSVRPGAPTLTIAPARNGRRHRRRRRRSPAPKHSGQFGGAAPDALLALIRVLASLHDDNGDVAVAGPPARGVDGRELQRRGVPLARRGAGRHAVHGHRRPRRADLVRARADRDRTRRAARRCAP